MAKNKDNKTKKKSKTKGTPPTTNLEVAPELISKKKSK